MDNDLEMHEIQMTPRDKGNELVKNLPKRLTVDYGMFYFYFSQLDLFHYKLTFYSWWTKRNGLSTPLLLR